MIVCRRSWRRHKPAHGECIHECVKEMLVFVSVCRRDFPVPAGLLRSAARRALRLRESELGNIDAQMIFGCGADPGFRVNSTAQMIVQISALRHAEQKVTELKRSEEHTSELQSQSNLVCRLLLEKKNSYPRHRSPSETTTAPTDPRH